MNILYLLIGVSLFAALVFLGLFIWAVRSGQYEDHYSPSVRILFDDEEKSASDKELNEEQKTKIKKDTKGKSDK